MDKKNILAYETVALNEEENSIEILNQTKLPGEVEILHLKELKDMWQAIYLLQVRGAPAIGVFAAFALYLAAKEIYLSLSTFNLPLLFYHFRFLPAELNL